LVASATVRGICRTLGTAARKKAPATAARVISLKIKNVQLSRVGQGRTEKALVRLISATWPRLQMPRDAGPSFGHSSCLPGRQHPAVYCSDASRLEHDRKMLRSPAWQSSAPSSHSTFFSDGLEFDAMQEINCPRCDTLLNLALPSRGLFLLGRLSWRPRHQKLSTGIKRAASTYASRSRSRRDALPHRFAPSQRRADISGPANLSRSGRHSAPSETSTFLITKSAQSRAGA
jgi:hypothetical protein